MKKKYIKVNDAVVNKGNDLCVSRNDFVKYYSEDAEVTISVIAYNRLETTKLCVESILKNTKNINYRLILVYNANEGQDDILEYFENVEYENKLVIHIEKNIGPALAYVEIFKNIVGQYYVCVQNDIIVTPNWLDNLITCAKSDVRIGMVTPVSSNVSNLQQVNLAFDSYDEMQQKAAEYNISDCKKWEERMRLINLGTLFTRPCLETIGNPFDIGFFNDFGDDDMSFRVRRAGYKCMLATDTWVHHDHDFRTRDQRKLVESITLGRKNFLEKYYGIDAWDDVNNFTREICNAVSTCDIDKPNIMGVDVKCGTPILEIKNVLRKLGKSNVSASAFTREAKYFIDLQTICDNGKVFCGDIEKICKYEYGNLFDFIVVGEDINAYSSPIELVENIISILSDKGRLFVYLKNVRDYFSFIYEMGEFSIGCKKEVIGITAEEFMNKIMNKGYNIKFVQAVFYEKGVIPNEGIDKVRNIISTFTEKDTDDIIGRLCTDKYLFEISK